MDFDIVGGFNQQPYVQFDGQRTINMYVEIDPEAKKPKALAIYPGHKVKVTPAEGSVVRALFVHKSSLYDVSSANVYKINTSFNPTKINASLPLSTSSGYIGIAANANDQVIFVDGAAGYLYKNSDNTFSAIGDSNFPAGATSVVYLDGFFIANVGGTNAFRLSNPNDGSNWTFSGQPREAFLTTRPDIIVGFAVLKTRLFIFGQYVTESWYNANAPIVTFRRDNNASLDYGCAAVGSIATGHQLLFWLSSTRDGVGPVVMTDGSVPIPASTRALEEEFQTYSVISDAVGYIIKIAGHLFYQLIFPTEGKTWVFDVNTKLWFELEAQGGARYASNCHAYFAGTHLIGDYASRSIYEVSESYYDHDGIPFRWKRITRNLSSPDYQLIRVSRIQLDTIKGQAAPSGIDAKPEIFLGVSRDGGVSYLPLLRETYTEIGRYKSRAVWWDQGIADDWVFSFEGYNALPFMILGASIYYEVVRS